MPGSLHILVTSLFVFSLFWLRDFLYVKFLVCPSYPSCLAKCALFIKSKQTEDDQNTKKRCYQNETQQTIKTWSDKKLSVPTISSPDEDSDDVM
jgi:hypothetical protein